MYPPNIANAANIIHTKVPLGPVFGTTGITVLFAVVSSAALVSVAQALLLGFSISSLFTAQLVLPSFIVN
jgi:hypothetical protein